MGGLIEKRQRDKDNLSGGCCVECRLSFWVVKNSGASLTTWVLFATVMLCGDNARGDRW